MHANLNAKVSVPSKFCFIGIEDKDAKESNLFHENIDTGNCDIKNINTESKGRFNNIKHGHTFVYGV